MTPDDIVFLGQDAMRVTLLASAPMLLSGMAIGLIISIFQSVTQIQEITLTFVPKIVVVLFTLVLFLPWMISLLVAYSRPMFGDFHRLVM